MVAKRWTNVLAKLILGIYVRSVRRVWRYHVCIQNLYIEEEEFEDTKGQPESVYRRRTDNTMTKRKCTKGQKRSTKHTYKTKDRVTRTPLKTGSELRCYGRVSSSCSTSGTRHVNLVTNPVISHELWKDLQRVSNGTSQQAVY
jgi:hypothetical protein